MALCCWKILAALVLFQPSVNHSSNTDGWENTVILQWGEESVGKYHKRKYRRWSSHPLCLAPVCLYKTPLNYYNTNILWQRNEVQDKHSWYSSYPIMLSSWWHYWMLFKVSFGPSSSVKAAPNPINLCSSIVFMLLRICTCLESFFVENPLPLLYYVRKKYILSTPLKAPMYKVNHFTGGHYPYI